MKLSELKFEDINIGLRVWSINKVKQGIVSLTIISKDLSEDNSVNFLWDDGKESINVWHFWCSNIELVN